MIFWLIASGAAAIAATALVLPLFRRDPPAAPETTRGLAIYRDQLDEIGRDLENGLISETEAGAARMEIERRILRAASESSTAAATDTGGARLFLAGLVLGIVPAGALALYLAVSMPPPAGTDGGIAAISDAASTPDALADLARSLVGQGRMAEAADALARAGVMAPHRADLRSLLGETQVAAADGRVTDEARQSFQAALTLDPRDPRARFYLGLARSQNGDIKGAIDDWLSLEADSRPDAPWRPMLAERLQSSAAEVGIDLARRRAELAPRGPTAADISAAEKMAPADRQQMIRGMVDGLAQRLQSNPGDAEGWLRLARARRVLGEDAEANDALKHAAAAAPDRVDILVEYARVLQPPGGAPELATSEFIGLMRRILRLDPNNAEGLFFVGEAEAKAGNAAEARALWGRLLARIDPKEPLHKMIDDRLKKLDQPR